MTGSEDVSECTAARILIS